MLLVRGLNNLRARLPGCVATIGNFDGVHLGHREMVSEVKRHAARLGLPSVVISFEPSPREFFAHGGVVPARLTRLREKFEALAHLGVDVLVLLRFNAQMAGVSPEGFVDEVLVRGLGVRHLVVGHDFRFAHRRAGSVETLQDLGATRGFAVEEVAPFLFEGERVSSSLVRAALADGNLYRAERLLGRPYRLSGKVGPGKQLGRTLGFPTANLLLHRKVTPLKGVFAVRATGGGLKDAPAVANLGTRPVLNEAGGETAEPLLEVHVFDFAGDLYRRCLHVDFVAKLRDERWFPSLESLTEQMHEDARQARDILAGRVSGEK
jgi:riboflavin kinase / FMN adenylyltransferase